MKSYDESVKINHNPNWTYVPDHPFKILIVSGSGSGKTNVLLNLTAHQRKKKVGIKGLKHAKTFTDYSQTIDDVYENLEDCIIQQRKKV